MKINTNTKMLAKDHSQYLKSNRDFSEILRLLRIAHDMTIKELSEKIGLSNIFISQIESGVKNPSSETLIKYCDVFDITPEMLKYFKEENTGGYQKLLLKILKKITKLSNVKK